MRSNELSKTHDTFLSFASVRCDSCLMPDIWHVNVGTVFFHLSWNVIWQHSVTWKQMKLSVLLIFFIFCRMLNNPAVTKSMEFSYIFLYFYHLSNFCICIYKIVTYKIVESILGTKWNISASQCTIAAIYDLFKFYLWTVTWSHLFIYTVLRGHCTAVTCWISGKFSWSQLKPILDTADPLHLQV
jgi:hypothetical protein